MDANIRRLAAQIQSVIGIGNLDNKELIGLSSLLQSDDKVVVLRVLHLLKTENDGTQIALNHIETQIQELRKSLARDTDRSRTNGQDLQSTPETGDLHTGRMQDTYDVYDNYGQHITGGDVEIRESQTTAPPPPGSRPQAVAALRPTLPTAGDSRDVYGSYMNYGQHVTNGKVVITKPKVKIQ